MKVYGLKIENTGVEFSTREDREKALVIFTKGSTVKIQTLGIRYKEGEAPFGTYERETNEVLNNCYECNGVFSNDSCPKRYYPRKSYGGEWETHNGHICDGCFAAQEKAKKIDDAKQTLKQDAA